jgi:hypothetical protein
MEIGMMMMNGGERGRENGRELTVNFETEPQEQVEADREVFGGVGRWSDILLSPLLSLFLSGAIAAVAVAGACAGLRRSYVQ